MEAYTSEDESHSSSLGTIVHQRLKNPSVTKDLWVVDLFCGAGGMAEGFRLAGFESVLAADSWDAACQTFRQRHKTAIVVEADLSILESKKLKEYGNLECGDVGVVCGGPPCQGFSMAGARLSDDPRNVMYTHFINAVGVLQPKWVVIENVPNLLNHPEAADGIYADLMELEIPKKFKYSVQHIVVNSADYGVPQTRSRVIFVAKRNDVQTKRPFVLNEMMAPLFEENENLLGSPTYVTVDEALNDLPIIYAGGGSDEMPYKKPANNEFQKVMRGEVDLKKFFSGKNISEPKFTAATIKSSMVYNHKAQDHSALLIERFKNIPPGGSKKDLERLRPDLAPPDGHPEQGLSYGRLWLDKPSPTLPANYSRPSGNRSIHPRYPRLVTPREAMRLSSFPDSYRLYGGMVAQREQVGNAVPPLLAFHLAHQIRLITK